MMCVTSFKDVALENVPCKRRTKQTPSKNGFEIFHGWAKGTVLPPPLKCLWDRESAHLVHATFEIINVILNFPEKSLNSREKRELQNVVRLLRQKMSVKIEVHELSKCINVQEVWSGRPLVNFTNILRAAFAKVDLLWSYCCTT